MAIIRALFSIGKGAWIDTCDRCTLDTLTSIVCEKSIKSVGNVLCSSKNVSIFAADFAAHVLLTIDAHALVKSRV